MNIYIDESGTFVNSHLPDSWCVVGAYAIPDQTESAVIDSLSRLKSGITSTDEEIKLNSLSEHQFLCFLEELAQLDATFHAVATDSYLNTIEIIAKHQQKQSQLVVEHIDKMKYEEGRQALIGLRDRILALSPQLYVQLTCRIILMSSTIHSIIPYHIQRTSSLSLSHFSWRIDCKNISRTNFEDTFEILGPPILQTISFSKPFMMIKGLDYSVMRDYLYSKKEVPKYLKETYGLDVGKKGGLNIQKLIREDIDFIDSKVSHGVQVVDLLVSGLRKCLRLQWKDNPRVADAIGRLMIQAPHNDFPLSLVALSTRKSVRRELQIIGRILRHSAKPFVHENLLAMSRKKKNILKRFLKWLWPNQQLKLTK